MCGILWLFYSSSQFLGSQSLKDVHAFIHVNCVFLCWATNRSIVLDAFLSSCNVITWAVASIRRQYWSEGEGRRSRRCRRRERDADAKWHGNGKNVFPPQPTEVCMEERRLKIWHISSMSNTLPIH